ncbi:BnaC06g15970D [Brassica napus]|uniref:BnaC06g15970D protein n=2 Tax=Brassica napus TaxID=3708 RepID=A0A078H3S2_BRANA|nr:BnaC06g15970D [Brassica napus]
MMWLEIIGWNKKQNGGMKWLQRRGCYMNHRVALLSSHFSPFSVVMASEKEAALAAIPSDSPTIFDKIISREIPHHVVYEDDNVLAFRDIRPQGPIHILVIPKVKDGLTGLSKAEENHSTSWAAFSTIVINDGPQGCQAVYHIHVHVIGGRQMNWPPG